ncbi:hypothetical protein HK096_002271 [Nowakowskiella sp. JEL0078]|nr:hypothetical protein HK096_002271 [Nowakowskiella sp. JEL0078]
MKVSVASFLAFSTFLQTLYAEPIGVRWDQQLSDPLHPEMMPPVYSPPLFSIAVQRPPEVVKKINEDMSLELERLQNIEKTRQQIQRNNGTQNQIDLLETTDNPLTIYMDPGNETDSTTPNISNTTSDIKVNSAKAVKADFLEIDKKTSTIASSRSKINLTRKISVSVSRLNKTTTSSSNIQTDTSIETPGHNQTSETNSISKPEVSTTPSPSPTIYNNQTEVSDGNKTQNITESLSSEAKTSQTFTSIITSSPVEANSTTDSQSITIPTNPSDNIESKLINTLQVTESFTQSVTNSITDSLSTTLSVSLSLNEDTQPSVTFSSLSISNATKSSTEPTSTFVEDNTTDFQIIESPTEKLSSTIEVIITEQTNSLFGDVETDFPRSPTEKSSAKTESILTEQTNSLAKDVSTDFPLQSPTEKLSTKTTEVIRTEQTNLLDQDFITDIPRSTTEKTVTKTEATITEKTNSLAKDVVTDFPHRSLKKSIIESSSSTNNLQLLSTETSSIKSKTSLKNTKFKSPRTTRRKKFNKSVTSTTLFKTEEALASETSVHKNYKNEKSLKSQIKSILKQKSSTFSHHRNFKRNNYRARRSNNAIFSRFKAGNNFIIDFACDSIVSLSDCSSAKETFRSAGEIISQTINLVQPIFVKAQFMSFCAISGNCDDNGQKLLGQATAASYWALNDAVGADPDYWYPQALAKQIVGSNSTLDWSTYDIAAQFNSDKIGNKGLFWFPNSNTTVQKGQYDFLYVILHEMIHGLGFVSSWGTYVHLDPSSTLPIITPILQTKDNSTQKTFSSLPLYIFDKYLVANNKRMSLSYDKMNSDKLFDFIPSLIGKSDSDVTSTLKSSNAFSEGYNLYSTSTTTGKILFKGKSTTNVSNPDIVLHTEYSPFKQGSSLSHLDQSLYASDVDFLMRPEAPNGVTLRSLMNSVNTQAPIGPRTRMILWTIGYTLVGEKNTTSFGLGNTEKNALAAKSSAVRNRESLWTGIQISLLIFALQYILHL